MLNKVILIGNLGADPEIRTLEGGVKVGRLRIATTERMYNRQTQEGKDHTEWHSVTVWRNLADYADRFIKKGSQVYIEGRIRSRDWNDDKGVKRYAIEIVADDMKILGRRSDSAQGQQGASAPQGGASGGQGYSSPQPQPQPAISSPAQTADVPPMEDPDDLPF